MDYKPSIFNIEIPYGNRIILYNTYTGALSLLEKPLADCMNEEHKAEFVKQGFCVDQRLNEMNRLMMERNRELYTARMRYLHIEIAPTMKCQARCWYCFENNGVPKPSMTQQVVQDVISYIIQRIIQTQCERLTLLFFGGEPLLAVEQIKTIGSKIKQYCAENGVLFHSEIITNGIAFTENVADELISAIALSKVQITLDGMQELHDKAKGIPCFDAVVDNIVRNAAKAKISVRLNVSSKNYKGIEPLVAYLLSDRELDGKIRIYLARVDDLDSCGVPDDGCLDNFSFADFRNDFVRSAVRKYKSFELKDLLPEIKRNYCGYEKLSQIMIGPEGELYRCQRTLSGRDNAIGDIYNGSFYSDEELSLLRPLPDECMKPCSLVPACFGGCPNQRRKGKILSYCELKRLQIEKDVIAYVDALVSG